MGLYEGKGCKGWISDMRREKRWWDNEHGGEEGERYGRVCVVCNLHGVSGMVESENGMGMK